MQKDAKHDEAVSAEVQDVIKHLISAIRIVKIYPPNNPVYAQSLNKAFESLSRFLADADEFHVGVQKTYFLYRNVPVGKDAQLNRSIAQDLFAKGLRDMIFTAGVSAEELQELYSALALSWEDLSMRSGVSTVLWEQGVSHIKVTEAGLDEVIAAKTTGGWDDGPAAGSRNNQEHRSLAGRALVLSDLKTDPEAFGAGMLEFAKKTRSAQESVEDRLYALYRQAGLRISRDHAPESELLFEGLAKSVLALEPVPRTGLIAGKLYRDADAEIVEEGTDDQVLPNVIDEIRSGRFADVSTVQQVAILLKRSVSRKAPGPAVPPHAAGLHAVPLAGDMTQMVSSLDGTSPGEMEQLRAISDAGMESDIIAAAVRTLVALIPRVRNERRPGTAEKEIALFSGVIQQLEDILSYLLRNNKYDLATTIIKALNMQVDPRFKPRMTEALKKTATKPIVKSTITNMRKYRRGSPEYHAAYEYLSNLEQKATEALLELLSEESDRNVRIFLLDLMKDFAKDQLSLLAEYMTDGRWYVVRNIVSILAESRTDQALVLLRKAADHKNMQIRQEVIKALLVTGGKKAASILAKFLRDPDPALQLTAVLSFGEMQGLGPDDARPVIEFLKDRPLNRKNHELTVAAIRTLGRIGGGDAALFLYRFARVRWWKPRRLQLERRDAALGSIEEITRRHGDGRTA